MDALINYDVMHSISNIVQLLPDNQIEAPSTGEVSSQAPRRSTVGCHFLPEHLPSSSAMSLSFSHLPLRLCLLQE